MNWNPYSKTPCVPSLCKQQKKLLPGKRSETRLPWFVPLCFAKSALHGFACFSGPDTSTRQPLFRFRNDSRNKSNTKRNFPENSYYCVKLLAPELTQMIAAHVYYRLLHHGLSVCPPYVILHSSKKAHLSLGSNEKLCGPELSYIILRLQDSSVASSSESTAIRQR